MSFNVRIQNKYDTLQNWLDSSLVLKAGEIALATVDTKDANSGEYVPTVLMKVGDGSKTFAQLPWTAARAADVYGWAKLENPTIEQLPGNLKTAITNLQAAIGEGGSVADAIKAAIDGLDNNDAAVDNQFVTAAVQVDGKVTVSRRALEAADIPALEISKINGLQSALNAKLSESTFNTYKSTNDEAVQANATAIATEKTRAEGVEAQLRTDVDAKVEKKTGYSLISDAEIERLAGVHNYDDTALAGRVTTAEGKIADLETESAKHALKTEVQAVDAKFASYRTSADQDAIDNEQNRRLGVIEGDYLKAADIANFETKENVKKVADDLAAYEESNDAAVAERYTKTEADAKFALKGTDAYDDTEVRGLITKNAEDIAAEAQRAAGVESGLDTRLGNVEKDYLKAADKTELQDNIDTLAGVVETLSDGIDPNKVDGVKDLIKYVDEHGTEVTGMKEDIEANAAAIKLESETARTAEGLLSGRLDTLEAIDHEAYIAADAALKAELQKEIDDDVKAAIDAEVERANGAYDAAGAAATAKSEAIADAATKYEEIGVAQDLIDGLKLSETYEPIGAKDAAIAAAKTETENQVKALADGAVATNTAEIAKIVAGTTPVAKATDADKLGGQAAANYLLKTEAPGYADILTKTAAEAGYKKVQTAVAEKGAANKTLKISQNAQGVIATEEVDIAIAATQVSGLATVATSGKINDLTQTENTVIVFNCGTASTVI